MNTSAKFALPLLLSFLLFALPNEWSHLERKVVWTVCGAALVVTLALLLFVRNRAWAKTQFPWLKVRAASPFLFISLCCSAAVTSKVGFDVAFPTGSMNFQIEGDSQSKFLLLLGDREPGGKVGVGRVADDAGGAVFEDVRYGQKKLIILRQLPDSSWEVMAIDLSLEAPKAERPIKFNGRNISSNFLTPVHFKNADFEVSVAERNIIFEQRKVLENPEDQLLLILANTDENGDSFYNDDLGQRRAKALMELLRNEGFPKKFVRSYSFGKRWQKSPASPYTREQKLMDNRRIEWLFAPVFE